MQNFISRIGQGGGGGGGGVIIYSLEEHIVGKWIDGKDLYAITKVFDTVTTGTIEININHGISNIDTCVDFTAIFNNPDNGAMQKNRIQPTSMTSSAYVNALIGLNVYSFNRTQIKVMVGNTFASGTARIPKMTITFYYTKL